jgi:hypothetical protein
MNFKTHWHNTITAFAVLLSLLVSGCANMPNLPSITSLTSPSSDNSISIVKQGSFFVGGRMLTAPGTYDPTQGTANTDPGQNFWMDQMYVHYQIPANARKYPLILVHGGSGTGRVWETTPDGREGYQTLMLRRGFPVYIVDFPRRGRAGYPSFNGPFGTLAGDPVVANRTGQAGVQYAWSRWRLGPKYPEVFPVQQFPMQAVDQFMQHLVPTVSDNAEIISGALIKLLEKSVRRFWSRIHNRDCLAGSRARVRPASWASCPTSRASCLRKAKFRNRFHCLKAASRRAHR